MHIMHILVGDDNSADCELIETGFRHIDAVSQIHVRELNTNNPALNEYANFVRNGVNRRQVLIRDLLTYSRIVHLQESGTTTADLNEALEQALFILKDRIGENEATVTVEPLPLVQGETTQLIPVFQNLIANALKYRNPDLRPVIRIKVHREDSLWVISVQDNGIGFEQKYAETIFGLFKRLHREKYPGSGLGLAICQRIIDRYVGRIWAEGTLGEGSTFHFSLPEAKEGISESGQGPGPNTPGKS